MLAPRKIAVFLPNPVGDVVMATPALRALRRHFADSHIIHVGRPAALATVAGTTDADDTIADASPKSHLAGVFALAARLRREGVDLAILLPNSLRTALVAKLGRIGRILGYFRDGRGWMLTDGLVPLRAGDRRPLVIPMRDYYGDLLAELDVCAEGEPMSLPVLEADEAAAEAILAEAGVSGKGPLVMLNPGASFGTSKMWSASRYAAVADLLIERLGAAVILNAAPPERPIARWVAEAMRHAPAVSFADRDNTIGLLKALVRRCDLLVTNDTGARHVAAALGTAVVTVFGSTDPQWSRIDYDREVIVCGTADCAPCQQKLCGRPAGPGYHECMESVSPEEVFRAAEKLLDGWKAQPPAPVRLDMGAVRAALRRAGLDTVQGAFNYAGGEDLDKPGLGGRRRTRVETVDEAGRTHVLYLKRYGPQPVVASLRRWWTHRRRASAARVEFENIRLARAAGVPTMQAVGADEDPCPIGALRSYLVVTAVPGDALERCFDAFCARHADDGRVADVTGKLARLVRTLHGAGFVHRDLYASHVFLDDSSGEPQLYLIDLARMFAPRWRKSRWRVKDLAQLKYSMPAAWLESHWPAFLTEYLRGAGAAAGGRLVRAIDRKVASMRRRAERRRARAAGGENS